MKTTTPIEYAAILANVKANLATLSKSASDNFGIDPDKIDWTNVSSICRINDALLSAMRAAGVEP